MMETAIATKAMATKAILAASDNTTVLLIITAHTVPDPRPPATPSQVFPGLTFVARRLRPQRLPTKKAAPSATQTKAKSVSSMARSFSSNQTMPDHAGNNTTRPQKPLVATPMNRPKRRRCAATTSVAASNHQTTASTLRYKNSRPESFHRHIPNASAASRIL